MTLTPDERSKLAEDGLAPARARTKGRHTTFRITVQRSGDPNDAEVFLLDASQDASSPPSVKNGAQANSWVWTNDLDDLLTRITTDERILGGKPIIRGMRFAVEHIIGMLAAGDSVDTILSQYPILEPEDIQACLVFAHRVLSGQDVSKRVNTTP